MLFVTTVLLGFVAFSITAYPHPESGWTHHLESPSNATLSTRAEKGICTTLDLPTEASYKIGYEAFCNRYAPADSNWAMYADTKPIVATVMIKSHLGSDIPWIFKVTSNSWGGGKPYPFNLMKCTAGFRDMLEGRRAKLGREYCVVGGSGGDGESKGFSGQGYVLKMGSSINWAKGDIADGSKYETRRRKGEFDPNNSKEE